MAPYDQVRLHELALSRRIQSQPPLVKLGRLTQSDVPNFVTPASEQRAEQCLAESKSSTPIRKPSVFRVKSRLEAYEGKVITAALPRLVDANESAGVIQALLNREAQLSSSKDANKNKSPAGERDALLLTAVKFCNIDLVWLLAPLTSLSGRNQALATALTERTSNVIQKLLEYDADPNHCSEQFLAAAAAGDHFIIEHLLSAPQAVRQNAIIEVLVPAVHSNSFRTLQRIVEVAELSGSQQVDAVKVAVDRGQTDALITLLLAASSIQAEFLDTLVLEASENPDIDADSLTAILHALFFAGASGPKSSASMRHSVEKRALNLVELFATHEVDINWGKGGIVKSAVETGQYELLHEVMRSGSLSKENASIAVQHIPHNLPARTRYEMLRALLEAGAYGPPIEKELVLAVKNDDRRLANLLRKKGTSIDTQQGEALIVAIQRENIKILGDLLSGPVEQFSLQRALPYVRHTSKDSRLHMTKRLLQAKVEGDPCHVALRDAVCDDSSDRDEELIKLLVQAGASPMFDDNQSLRYAILHEDFDLFETLLKSPVGVSEGAISSLIPEVMAVKDQGVRYYMMQSALDIRPKQDSLCRALSYVVADLKVDMSLLRLLVHSGQVSIDYNNGIILRSGVQAARPVFEELLRLSDRSRSTTSVALNELLHLQSWNDEEKADRAALLLGTKRIPTVATEGVLRYIAFCKSSVLVGDEWPLQTFEVLLNSGAEVAYLTRAGALLEAIKASATGLLAMLLKLQPPACDIDGALVEAVRLPCTNIVSTVQLILEAGPSKDGISSALVEASSSNLEEVCSILLRNNASVSCNDFAAIQNAAASGNSSLLNAFLEIQPTKEAMEAAFRSAKSLTDADQRYEIMQAILKIGVDREVLSKYLIHQVNTGPEPRMITLLLDNQADVHYQQNYSLVQATLQANLEIVQMLFAHVNGEPNVATQCFETCIQSNKIQQDRVPVLGFLLDIGVRGNSLNRALRQTIHNLPGQPGLLDLLEMLITHGADVNHDQGHTLCQACETVDPEAIVALAKGNPSIAVRSRAIHFLLKSSVSAQDFCQILDTLMKTEASATELPDLSTAAGGFENPVKVLLTRRPQGAKELAHLFKCQPKLMPKSASPDILAWAMVQEKIYIHDDCLALLIDHGADVNYRNAQSGWCVLFQAIKCQRSQLVRSLLLRGADSSVADNQGTSPLLLASILGDQVAVTNLLEAGAPRNDGSLHHAACSLKMKMVNLLLTNDHDPNFPSPQHQGRTPLAELLYLGKGHPKDQSTIEKIIHLLKAHGTETRKLVARKPLICWALDNKHDPVIIVQALLRTYLYRDLDEDFNLYNDGQFVYSPTMYVAKRQFQGPAQRADELITLLRDSGANRDVYYSLTGPQPEDAQGMPEDIAKFEMIRRAKLAMRREEEEDMARRRQMEDEERDRMRRIDEESHRRRREREEEDFQRQLMYRRHLEAEDQKLLRERNALSINLSSESEAARRRELQAAHSLELMQAQQRGESEKRLLRDRSEILRLERADELSHRTALGELEVGTTKQRLLLESDHQKMSAATAQSAIEAQHKEQKSILSSQDYYQEKMHKRRMKQLTMEKAMPVGTMTPIVGGYIEN